MPMRYQLGDTMTDKPRTININLTPTLDEILRRIREYEREQIIRDQERIREQRKDK